MKPFYKFLGRMVILFLPLFYSSIHIINADGSGNRKINATGYAPCWMSNNKQIIFSGVTRVKNFEFLQGLKVTNTDDTYEIDLKINGTRADCK